MFALIITMLWCGSAPAEGTATEECARALVSVAGALPPAIEDPRERAIEITTGLVSVVRGAVGVAAATDAIEYLNEVTRPAQDLVASFLQTRTNYASVFDVNEPAALASSLQEELTGGLDALKRERKQVIDAGGWRVFLGLQPKPAVPAEIVRRVRHLHHALRLAVDELTKSTNAVRQTLRRTAELLTFVDQTYEVLSLVLEEARAQIDNPEVIRRIETRRNDFVAQTQILRNVHLGLEQRLQYDGLVQDRVRTLLTVNLPLEAVMGTTTLDLSPLDFNVGTGAAAAPARPVDDRRLQPADLSAVVRTARGASTGAAQDSILNKFMSANITALTVAQVVTLASACRTNHGRNELLLTFAKARYRDFTQNELLALAETTTNDDYRSAIFNLIGKG